MGRSSHTFNTGLFMVAIGIIGIVYGSLALNSSCNPDYDCKDIQEVTLKDISINSYFNFNFYPVYRFQLDHSWEGQKECLVVDLDNKLPMANSTLTADYVTGKSYKMYTYFHDNYPKDYVVCDPDLNLTKTIWMQGISIVICGVVLILIGIGFFVISAKKRKSNLG